jgi:succinate-semialdehyde dehydrogenase/glutarate-semialdehyde dehydrogenase
VPNGLLATVLVADTDAPTRVAELIGDPRIRGVTFTGSNVVGSRIAALAAGAVKRSVLELGGSDPFVVLADADLAAAVDACVKSRFGNAGQSCVAGKRIILAEAIAAEFVGALVDRVRHMWVGDPMSEDTEIGPVARADLLAALERQVDHSVAAGAVLRCGGKRIDRPGWFYQPTVLTEVRPTAPVWSEEVFGPVAAVRVVESPEAAVRAARSSPYALGVSVWSANIESAAAVARQLSSGIVALNRAVESDPRMPFGGSDGSGYGRELGAAGTREFTVLRAWSAGAAS